MKILVKKISNTYMHNIFWMKISEKLLNILSKMVVASVSLPYVTDPRVYMGP